jgi:hypothetical protein
MCRFRKGFNVLTLSEALKSGRLQDFIVQEEARGIGPANRSHCGGPYPSYYSFLPVGASGYYIINFKHAPHLKEIEREIYGSRFLGLQARISREGGRVRNLTFNAVGWAFAIGISIAFAVWHREVFGK